MNVYFFHELNPFIHNSFPDWNLINILKKITSLWFVCDQEVYLSFLFNVCASSSSTTP